jgi:hypothetical protein
MSFLDRARQAAEQARQAAAEGIGAMTTPEAQAEMRQEAGRVGRDLKRGLVTAVEKIDPGILADLVIKATAIQEIANRSLREKGSIYRIGEITITASIPPQIGFAIERIGDVPEPVEAPASLISSQELVERTADDGEVVDLEGDVVETIPEASSPA